MPHAGFPVMVEKYTVSYTGVTFESALTLSRGTKWSIQKIEIYAPNAAAGGYFQVFRKNSASTAAQQDVTDSGSLNVLIGEFYYDASSEFKSYDVSDVSDLSALGLRVRGVSLGSTSMTIYINVYYYYTIA